MILEMIVSILMDSVWPRLERFPILLDLTNSDLVVAEQIIILESMSGSSGAGFVCVAKIELVMLDHKHKNFETNAGSNNFWHRSS